MRLRVVMSIGLALLLATACGGASEGTSLTTSEGDRPQSFDDLDFSSPIGEFLGVDFGASEDMEAEFAEMEREAGRLTTTCMQDKGFEYVPQDNSQFMAFGGPGGDVPYFSDEWVEKYGFGITTQRFPQSMVGDLVGFPDENFGGPDEEYVDPNDAYLESLSDAEREAYQEALWGQPPDFGPEGPSEDFEFEPSGCQNEAFEQAYNDGPGGNQEGFYETFGDDLEAMQERVMADPRVVAFNNEVADCAAAAGMDWTDQEELYMRFERRMEDLQPGGFGPGSEDPFEAAGLDPEEMTDREINDFFNELNRLDPAALVTLGELQAEELALAKVIVGCGGGPLNEQFVLGEIRVEYEQEFLDTNAAALEEFKSE